MKAEDVDFNGFYTALNLILETYCTEFACHLASIRGNKHFGTGRRSQLGFLPCQYGRLELPEFGDNYLKVPLFTGNLR